MSEKVECKQKIVSVYGIPCLNLELSKESKIINVPIVSIFHTLTEFFKPIADSSQPHNQQGQQGEEPQSLPEFDQKMTAP